MLYVTYLVFISFSNTGRTCLGMPIGICHIARALGQYVYRSGLPIKDGLAGEILIKWQDKLSYDINITHCRTIISVMRIV